MAKKHYESKVDQAVNNFKEKKAISTAPEPSVAENDPDEVSEAAIPSRPGEDLDNVIQDAASSARRSFYTENDLPLIFEDDDSPVRLEVPELPNLAGGSIRISKIIGKSKSRPKRSQVTYYLREDYQEKLRVLAQQTGATVSSIVESIMDEVFGE